MAIFNSYVKLPEGNTNKTQKNVFPTIFHKFSIATSTRDYRDVEHSKSHHGFTEAPISS